MIRQIMGHDLVADTLGGVLDQAVAERPDSVFALFDDERYTLRQLDDMARRIGAALLRSGLKSGDRLAALMYPSPWHLALAFACARHGVVWCPLNVALGIDDLAYTLNDLQPALVLVDDDLQTVLNEVRSGDARMAALPLVICSPTARRSTPAFSDGWVGTERAEGMCEAAASDSLAIIYSGGTSGPPKGIEVSQFYAVSSGLRLNELARFGKRETFFTVMQFSHAWTPLTILPWCLLYDHVFAFWRWWSASRFVDAAIRYNASITDVYAGMAATLFLGDAAKDTRSIPATRSIAGWGGDEEVSKRIRRQFEERFGVTTLQMYSLTEVGPLSCVEWEGEPQKFGSSGKPRGWYDVIVADDEGMRLPAGAVGEIFVRPNFPNILAKGYVNRAPHTLHTWRDLWVHTGDLGRYDEDGYLWFVGRQGHFVKRRGELVSVSEVESTLLGMPGIDEVAVYGVPSEMSEDEIKAVIVLKSGAQVTAQSVVDYCAGRLAYFKVPTYVQFVAEMPRSATKQEIERFKLKALPLGEPLRPSAGRRPLGYSK